MTYLHLISTNWHSRLLIPCLSILSLSISANPTSAQISGDNTLPANTQVNLSNNVYEITQGTARGDNLFHSFEQFSLQRGQEAFFNHNNGIETILGRVTGGEMSDIDGLIRTSGTADLFLINPQGIVFGPNATLEIGGSFIASSAERLIFEDGAEFSATNPQPLLTVSQPSGLVLGRNSGRIQHQSTSENQSTLEAPSGRSLILVGNGINLDGNLTALSGRVDLASLASGSVVDLMSVNNPNINDSIWLLDYNNTENLEFQNIQLANTSINTFSIEDAISSGNIQLRGRQIFLDESQLIGQTVGNSQGGTITITASEQLRISNTTISTETFSSFTGGTAGDIFIDVSEGTVQILNGSELLATSEPGDTGASAAGNLTINAARFIVRGGVEGGSNISTSTFTNADAGNLTINVPGGTVDVVGTNSRLRSQSEPDATGAAGNITINTARLRVRDGAQISTATLGDNGAAGNLRINALGGSVEIIGLDTGNGVSALATTTQGREDAGAIDIITGDLLVQNGGQIQSGTFGTDTSAGNARRVNIVASGSVIVAGRQLDGTLSQIASSTGNDASGNAGPVDIFANRIEVREGGQIFTSTNNVGNAGRLTLRANEVILSGEDSRLFARTRGRGDSGELILQADSLSIQNGARIDIGTEEGGPTNITLGTVQDASITANTIFLDNGEIRAESLTGNGGNLNFNVQDYVLLRNSSEITARAGTAGAIGKGGNITVTLSDGFVIAIPDENSDIVANAFNGAGGNINITAQGIYNLVERPTFPVNNDTNDVDASSQFGTEGIVTFNDPNVDPTQAVLELPSDIDNTPPIAQRCLADSAGQSAFVVTGRGGIAPNPAAIVRNEAMPLADFGSGGTSTTTQHQAPAQAIMPSALEPAPEPAPEPIIEAQTWQRHADGTIALVALTPTQTHSSLDHSSDHCPALVSAEPSS